jgi:CubicO group peptidase (beta-lactamase class C family)
VGKTLRDFDQENIFRPLGMSSTQIFNDHSQVIPHRATGYRYDDEKKSFGVEMSNFEQTGDGSVQTTVEDLLRWDENFYTAKLGGADLIRQMQVVGKLNNGKEHGYAAGLMIGKYRGQPDVTLLNPLHRFVLIMWQTLCLRTCSRPLPRALKRNKPRSLSLPTSFNVT